MKITKDDLGNRMKDNYENRAKTFLTRRTPVIIRLDGKAFHTFTKGMKRPFDRLLMETMQETTKYLCENIQGCKIGYTQSDEITLLLTDYDTLTTDAWFDYNIQKMCSVSASMATLAFNRIFKNTVTKYRCLDFCDDNYYWSKILEKFDKAMFDSRCFNIPKEEVVNCFVWRQQDATRNSIQMVGQSVFSHKELHGVSCNQIQNKLLVEKDINWNNFTASEKRGTCIIKVEYTDGLHECLRRKWIIDEYTPIFQNEREYIEKLI